MRMFACLALLVMSPVALAQSVQLVCRDITSEMLGESVRGDMKLRRIELDTRSRVAKVDTVLGQRPGTVVSVTRGAVLEPNAVVVRLLVPLGATIGGDLVQHERIDVNLSSGMANGVYHVKPGQEHVSTISSCRPA